MHLGARRAAADRDRDEQPDGRDHRVDERDRLPAPRRDRRLRRGPDGGRRLRRREPRVAARASARPVRVLRLLFVVVLVYTAFEMARRALGLVMQRPGVAWRRLPASRSRSRTSSSSGRTLSIGAHRGSAPSCCSPAAARRPRAARRSTSRSLPPTSLALRPAGFLWLGILGVLRRRRSASLRALIGFCAPQGADRMAPSPSLVLVVIAVGVFFGVMTG